MKFSRSTLAVALSSALILSACSGDGDVVEPTTATDVDTDGADTTAASDDGATSTAAGEDASSTTAPDGTDTAAGTGGPGDDAASTTAVMTTDEEGAVLSLEEAEEAAGTILAARVEADQGDGDDVRDAQRMSMMGNVRKAHEAADQLESVTGEPPEVEVEDLEPNVLAISRDDGELPMFLLVQTVPEEGMPLLHLLESRTGETKDFRISWEAPMLPGTEVPSFDRRSLGTPVLRTGQGDLADVPRDLLKELAAMVSYPQPDEDARIRTNGYAPSVRSAARDQADTVAGQARLLEKNWLVSDDTKTLLFEDGTAFVMGTLLRDTQFRVDSGSTLTPTESFRVFQDSSSLSEEAVLRTTVFVGLHAPTADADFAPEMIAAREQLVDAWGS